MQRNFSGFGQNEKSRGFTLFELLVVIAIIVIISGAVVVNLQRGQEGLALDRSAHKLAQDIRKAMEYTLRAVPYGGCPLAVPHFTGYGIFITTASATSYIMFADCDISTGSGDGRYVATAGDQIVETFFIEKGVKILSVDPDPAVHIKFIPPDPTLTIKGSGPPPTRSTIAVAPISDPTKQRTVSIAPTGAISIN